MMRPICLTGLISGTAPRRMGVEHLIDRVLSHTAINA
jgi:hypothetical protein